MRHFLFQFFSMCKVAVEPQGTQLKGHSPNVMSRNLN